MADAQLPRTDFYVYAIFRPDGSPCYIGKGTRNRLSGRRNRHVERIIAKYGDLPKVKLRQGLTESEAFECEIALIATIGRKPRGPLVNQTDGGEGTSGFFPSRKTRDKMRAARIGKTLTVETRAKQSKAAKSRPPLSPASRAKVTAAVKARPPASLEYRAAMSKALKNKPPVSPETRAKLSQAAKARPPISDEVRLILIEAWKHRAPASAETRAKNSAAHIGKKKTPETRAKMKAAWVVRKARQERSEALKEGIRQFVSGNLPHR